MRGDQRVAAGIVECALQAAVDPAHGQYVRLVEVLDGPVVLAFAILDYRRGARPVTVGRQRPATPVLARIAHQPVEPVLLQPHLAENLVAQAQHVGLFGVLSRRHRTIMPRQPVGQEARTGELGGRAHGLDRAPDTRSTFANADWGRLPTRGRVQLSLAFRNYRWRSQRLKPNRRCRDARSRELTRFLRLVTVRDSRYKNSMDSELLATLLPHLGTVVVEEVGVADGVVRIRASTRAETPWPCPGCRTPSGRVHSRYLRHPADLAIGGQPVVIDLSVRRLLCNNQDCVRHSFAEQVEALTTRYGRRTPGLLRVLQKVALALAGRAGARLAAVLGAVVSRTAPISLIMRLPEPVLGMAPRVLGVDDFALRKGKRYGTILLDMESHRAVDVLPDREGATFAAWLRAHPGAEIICRDRASAYAAAAEQGAPGALQVADRWHIWSNLCDHVENEVARHRACLAEPTTDTAPEHDQERQAQITANTAALCEAKYRGIEQTRMRYQAVHEQLAAGASVKAAARALGLAYNTAPKYAQATSVEELLATGWQNQPTILDAFKSHLHNRLTAGSTLSDSALFREIQAQGYRGSLRTMSRYLRELRTIGAVPTAGAIPPAKPRDLATWITSPPESLDEDAQTRLKAVLERCPELRALTGQVRDFAEILTNLRGEQLAGWLESVYVSDLPSLNTFANGIGRDRAAVLAGLTLPWSSGTCEDAVNRVKMLMRQTFGRAGFPLLRRRILLT